MQPGMTGEILFTARSEVPTPSICNYIDNIYFFGYWE